MPRLIAGTRQNVTQRQNLIGDFNFYGIRQRVAQRQNLALQSESIGTSPWSLTNTTIVTASGIAPDGNNTMSLIYPSIASGLCGVWQAGETTKKSEYVYSIYAKAAGKNYIMLIRYDKGQFLTWFDLATGAVATDFTGKAKIENMGNGIYRCSTIYSAPAGAVNNIGWYLTDNNGSSVATQNGTNGVLLWGAQVNRGNNLSPYVKTTTVRVNDGPIRNIIT